MTDERMFDHLPDPELGAALRQALEPGAGTEAAFVAGVLARYDAARAARAPTWEVLAAWARPGIAAAVAAAALCGFLVGRALQTPDTPASFDTAFGPTNGPGLAALVTAPDPPDASVVFASLVEQR
jgi:hypothetical protein